MRIFNLHDKINDALTSIILKHNKQKPLWSV